MTKDKDEIVGGLDVQLAAELIEKAKAEGVAGRAGRAFGRGHQDGAVGRSGSRDERASAVRMWWGCAVDVVWMRSCTGRAEGSVIRPGLVVLCADVRSTGP
ncbi:hypothetical protein E1200_32560 [Actinomadura sp. GC306]|uniref:hypothetical protein n=1 Tax=Actinomadura sp. GC306 TaxID=2530367 RepID=UPI0010473FD1|nr:hypothetical protein [Actinomadura sp. GC306]TDC59073.1 hypothetical protein E1200_32560 [Actinomadura sp. GC306]